MRQFTDSTQIDQWFVSTRRDAQELLPHLIRLLINATVDISSILALRIPVDDEINLPGCDGVVEIGKGNRHVPAGLSVWEMGTGNPAEKAERDYRNRTNNPGDIALDQTTFIFVTPHRWSEKDEWLKSKQQENRWKDVKVIDSIDLAAWLEVAPGVARWLARQMGVLLEGLLDVELFTKEFNAAYGSDIPSELIIGGRKDAVEEFDKLVDKGLSEITIEGESVEEAAAFVAASILNLPRKKRDWLLSRTLFAQQPDVLDFVSHMPSVVFVVPLTVEARRRAKAVQSDGLRLILPTARIAGSRSRNADAIRLGTIKRDACERVLIDSGTIDLRARRIAQECKGSLTAALWMLGHGPDTPLPWTEGQAAIELAPLLLAGQWVVDSATDKSVIEKLAGRSYEKIRQTLATWSVSNGPLKQRSDIWDWLAADYAWECLASVLDRDLLSRFENVVYEVLGEADPGLNLKPDHRWAAAIYDKSHPYSGQLRAGLVASLVQLALHDDDVQGGGAAFAGQIITKLLTGNLLARNVAWQSLAPWLPDMAEAAPTAFLSATEALINDREAIADLFTEGGIFGSSPHVYLLWALERLVWSKDIFTSTVSVLGDLASVDPGGQLRNRPSNSLTEIFLPWHPQGSVDVEHRFNTIDMLYDRQPEVAWSLAVSLLPSQDSLASSIAEPQWRDWKPAEKTTVTNVDYWHFVKEISNRMIKWAEGSGRRWITLIETYSPLLKGPPELAKSVLSSIQQIKPDDFGPEDRLEISDTLRGIVTRHREYPDAEWVMNAEELQPFVDLQTKFLPQELTDRHKWLFESWPSLPQERELKYEEHSKILEQMRLNALQEIYDAQELTGVLRFVEMVQSPEAVGFSISKISLGEGVEAQLIDTSLGLAATRKEVPPLLRFGLRYVGGKYRVEGEGWLDRVRSLPGVTWDANKLVNLAWGLPEQGATWDRLKTWSEEAAKLYWSRCPLQIITNEEHDVERAVVHLLKAGRPYRAIHITGMFLCGVKDKSNACPISKEIILQALSSAPKQDMEAEWYPPSPSMLTHYVEKLLDVLEMQGIAATEIEKLEWAWMPILVRSKRGLKALQEAVSTTPSLFIDLLKLMYLGKGEEPHELSEQDQARATQAGRLLENLKRVPGTQGQGPQQEDVVEGDITFDGGQVDQGLLFAWVKEARRLAKECNRLDVCDLRIGDVLAYAPTDPDGTWPCEPVRNLIESVNSEKLGRGIVVGVYNKRGVHRREKGGKQEWRLAQKFRQFAQQASSRWPRTASVLSQIVNGFEQQAKREDEQTAFEEFE